MFEEMKKDDLTIIEGGCTGCKVGGTLVTVGSLIAFGVSGPALFVAAVALYTIWG